MRPHITEHLVAHREFLRALERGEGPRNAAMRAMGQGAYVSPEWLRANYCPTLLEIDRLNAMGDTRGAIMWRSSHPDLVHLETAALALCEARRTWAETTSPDDDDARKAAEHEAQRQKDRAAFVAARGAQLFDAWLEAKRESFRTEAGAEWDALHPAAAPLTPAPTPSASVVSIAPAKSKRTTKTANNEPPSAA